MQYIYSLRRITVKLQCSIRGGSTVDSTYPFKAFVQSWRTHCFDRVNLTLLVSAFSIPYFNYIPDYILIGNNILEQYWALSVSQVENGSAVCICPRLFGPRLAFRKWKTFHLITTIFCFLAAYVFMYVCICLGICLYFYIYMHITCTHTYIFSFKTKPKVSQKVKLARDRKPMAWCWFW